MLTENSNMANEKEGNHAEIVRYQCHVHEKDLMPLLCKDCKCPVCLDCLTTSHAGHTMGKLLEYIDDKIEQLNGVVLKNDSTCFDLKKIGENLQKRRQEGKKQVEEMLQRVTATEEEIVKEVKNVCQQTIDQITEQATEIENPMVRDEQLLNSILSCNLFRRDSDEDCIKCFYFYNKLEMLGQKYGSGDQEDVPFKLMVHDFSTDKIFELVVSKVTDEQSSSDENLEQKCDVPTNPHETNDICRDAITPHQYKKKFTDGSIDSILSVSGDRSILRSKDVMFHQSNTDVEKLVDKIEHFTYVPETDEILVILKGHRSIYRKPISTKGPLHFLMSFDCDSVLCMDHDEAAYLVVVLKCIFKNVINPYIRYNICTIDDTGCHTKPSQTFESSYFTYTKGRIKIIKSSFVTIDPNKVYMTKGLTFNNLFSYNGCIGNNPASTFSPVDVCTDPDGNFLVIDSHDDTVHLLDKKGTFLRIIMSTEDGLSGIKCMSLDAFGWLLIGCNDGMVHFVNYQYFKSTTRKERCLQRQKAIKATDSLELEEKPDTLKLLETN